MAAFRVEPNPIEEHFVVHWDQPVIPNVSEKRNVVFHASRVGDAGPRFVAKFIKDNARERREIEVKMPSIILFIDCR